MASGLDSGGYRGKRVAVLGLGLSNLAVVHFLLGRGADVTVYDQRGPAGLGERYTALAGAPVRWRLGPAYLADLAGDGPFDQLFLTPGIRKDLPEIAAARRAGAEIDSEMGLFFRFCRAPIVGVTGSAGKTTTTTLTGRILARSGRPVFVGGNIGEPLLPRLDEIGPDALVVVELSSFQLQVMSRSPRVAVFLNIRPNHLDMHSSFEEYMDAKKNILRFQPSDGAAILNADDPSVAGLAAETPAPAYHFSRERILERGAFVRDGQAVLRGFPALAGVAGGESAAGPLAEIPLLGAHNVSNVLAALAAGAACGIPPGPAWEAVRAFRGVEHRLEFVREKGGARFYNDSIATAPDRAEAALDSFDSPIVLIAGGYDKKIPFNGLGEKLVDRVRLLVLLGQTAPKIRRAVEEAAARRGVAGPDIREASDFPAAVRLAAGGARPGEVVLLAPACASYDMFNNYEERGRLFKSLVHQL